MTNHNSHTALSSYFTLHRRYLRSVNLERDLDRPETVQGYVPTERSADVLRRILAAIAHPNAHRAWTMTGVYGTGKSAFVHYLLALLAPEKSKVRQEAVAIAQRAFAANSPEQQAIASTPSKRGLIRAAATGRREPLCWTIARALVHGADSFWAGKKKPDELFKTLTDWRIELERRQPKIVDQDVLNVVQDMVGDAKTHVFIAIDELGKNLEFATHHQSVNDLYLLQQLAEFTLDGEHQIYFLGVLHQSFAGYSDRLSAVEQSEWNKIQGRFEDVLFVESPNQMTRLIGQAIDHRHAAPVLDQVQQQADQWVEALAPVLAEHEVSASILADACPLHPIAALALPQLCVRYAQNDRSLFTFLTSDEPYAFGEFLNTATVEDSVIPMLQLHQIYDYFVESVAGLTSRINLQRWVEIQSLIQDARDQSPDVLRVLKTIGVLNLVTSAGNLRATPRLVSLALCDRPDRPQELNHWQALIETLQSKGLITYRRQLDELKIWEGSDFNVEGEIRALLEKDHAPLAETLTRVHPLKPAIAQRHYTTTGNLRFFEQRYGDSRLDLHQLRCSAEGFDGLILYWLDTEVPEVLPAHTQDDKPLLVVRTEQLDLLRLRAQEFRAIQSVKTSAPELSTDGVARKEVKHRLIEAERLLDETLAQAFNPSGDHCRYWVSGKATSITSTRAFQSVLSDVCGRTYAQSIILDNELINRRDLTSQGAKARRQLIETMLEHSHQQRLGLRGYGPEVAMYYSVLEASGIHRLEEDHPEARQDQDDQEQAQEQARQDEDHQEENGWGFYPPYATSGLVTIWAAIEQFCLESQQQQRSLYELYDQLQQPPYGIKPGVIPVVLAAVLLYHVDDVGIYKDGTFIPVLGPEHFELLVKDPSRFSVKYFEMMGLRSQVFKELEIILRGPNAKAPTGVRNASLLVVAKPLFSFVRKLPKYTLQTQRISPEAQQVLKVLQKAQEPDELLFLSLPQACGFEPMQPGKLEDDSIAKAFRKRLVQCLHEIQTAYEALLSLCKTRLYDAFGVRQEANLREDVLVQATPLVGRCLEPTLKRFILAAVDEQPTDAEWLEALAMIVADKPPKSWNDDDLLRFELGLSDLVRRFRHLEALQKEVRTRGSGFSAKRLTVTEQDGYEVNQIIWMDAGEDAVLNAAVEKALDLPELQDNPRRQQAFIAKLSDRLLSRPRSDLEPNSHSETERSSLPKPTPRKRNYS